MRHMSTLPSTPKTGQELLDAIQDVTLDEVMRRDPHAKPLSDEELQRLVLHLRAERAQITLKKEKRREKKDD